MRDRILNRRVYEPYPAIILIRDVAARRGSFVRLKPDCALFKSEVTANVLLFVDKHQLTFRLRLAYVVDGKRLDAHLHRQRPARNVVRSFGCAARNAVGVNLLLEERLDIRTVRLLEKDDV